MRKITALSLGAALCLVLSVGANAQNAIPTGDSNFDTPTPQISNYLAYNPTAAGAVTSSWSSVDAFGGTDTNNGSASGSARLVAQPENDSTHHGLIFSGCLPVVAGTNYNFGVSCRIDTFGGSNADCRAEIAYYSDAACTVPLSTVVGSQNNAATTGVFVALSDVSAAPLTAQSAMIGFTGRTTGNPGGLNQKTFDMYFDRLFFGENAVPVELMKFTAE